VAAAIVNAILYYLQGAMSDSTFDAPVWHNGKALRKGYTTGSCATRQRQIAALMVLRQHLIHQVSIVTPSGVTLCLNVESPHVEGQQAIAAIRKDGAMMSTPPTAC
jgi:cobalt-precorrin-5B (C1)-methyltransferase